MKSQIIPDTLPITRPKLFTQLLKAQQSMNNLLYPDWEIEDIDLPLAVADEAMECAKQAGYEWWKTRGTPDILQMQYEYIDALHFYLSIVLKRVGVSGALGMLNSGNVTLLPYGGAAMGMDNVEINNEAIIHAARNVARYALMIEADVWDAADHKINDLGAKMRALAYAVGLTEETAPSMYFAKNVLNAFRKANGYKDGSYIKVWTHNLPDPMEDNEFLASAVTNYVVVEEGGPFQSLQHAEGVLIPKLTAAYKKFALNGADV